MIRELRFQHALASFSSKTSRTQRPLHQCRCIKHLLFGKPTFNYHPSFRLAGSACKTTPRPFRAYSALCVLQQSFNDPGQKDFFFICLGTELNRETMIGMPEMLMLGPKSQLLFACPSIAKKCRLHWFREERESTEKNSAQPGSSELGAHRKEEARESTGFWGGIWVMQIVIYCSVSNYHRHSGLKQHRFIISVSVGQETRYSLAGSSAS